MNWKFQHRQAVLALIIRSRSSSGLTILELLTVIVILGILSAIALPTLMRQGNRAKEAEAKTFVGISNRAQQVYFMEHSAFGDLVDLDLNIADSRYYRYTSLPDTSSIPQSAITTAEPIEPYIRGFTGKVWSVPPSTSLGELSLSILCEGELGQAPVVAGTTCP